MTRQSLAKAVAETQRFIRLAEAVKWPANGVFIVGTKDTAAAKRASLDLTRALAEMRSQR